MVFRGLSKALLLLGTPRLVAQCFSFGSPWVSLDPKKKGALSPWPSGRPIPGAFSTPAGKERPPGTPRCPRLVWVAPLALYGDEFLFLTERSAKLTHYQNER